MSIKIFNSLTKQKQEFKPLNEKKKVVNMYTCGVTVYDKCHIGHARSLYVFDVIRNYLEYRGYKVNFVRNITDVDDKIINKAKETGKDWKEVVSENIAIYKNDLKTLGIGDVSAEPRATDKENIKEMQKYISEMISQGFAYEVEGDVYFNVRKYNEKFKYGELSGQSIDQMEEAVRIDKDAKKKDSLDFALWKKSKEGEPSWKSPWGEGRPGWHIECSCMSRLHLKCDTLDIHAGGRDLIFPHHENEIAQAQAYDGNKFSNCWIHHGLLTINKQKMAKSLGNFITIEDAVEKYGADVLKMFFLSSHYRSNIDFSEKAIEDAKKRLDRIKILINKIKKKVEGVSKDAAILWVYEDDFKTAMNDDFNTPNALSFIDDIVTECNKIIDNDEGKESSLKYAFDLLEEFLGIFGIKSVFEGDNKSLSDDIEKILADRVEARKNKDFKKSDELRDLLKSKGIIIEDGKDGQTWRRA